MEKAAKVDSELKRIGKLHGISEHGLNWFLTAVDPFHDVPLELSGYPDKVMTPSVVQMVRTSFNVSEPGLGIWDCNIFLDQFALQENLYTNTAALTQQVLNSAGQGTTYALRGGVVVRAASTGTPLGLDTSRPSSVPLARDVYENSDARLLGIGLEIHNTTAELNKQGSALCWRTLDVPAIMMKTLITDINTACQPTSVETRIAVSPPETLTEAAALPNSVGWDAKEGAYIVPIFVQEDNEPAGLTSMPLISEDSTTGGIRSPKIDEAGAQRNKFIDFANCSNAMLPTSCSGVFLTGLSPETTLTVNVVYYMEVFPEKDNILRRSTKPSSPEDIKAIELYTKVARELPAGVKVKDNFLGAFISGIGQIARAAMTYAPKVISAVNTAVSYGSTMATVGAQIYNSLAPNEKKLEIKAAEQNKTFEVVAVPTNSRAKVSENNNAIVVYKPTNGIRQSKVVYTSGPTRPAHGKNKAKANVIKQLESKAKSGNNYS